MTQTTESDPGPGLQGHYANAATRSAAFVTDLLTIAAFFAIGSTVIQIMLEVFVGRRVNLPDSQVAWGVGLLVWAFVYFAYPLAMSGRTFGMAIVGLRAVRADGSDLSARRAVVRVLALPLSFLFFGLGFILIVLRRDHRALHDLISGAAVVYGWNARVTHLRFLGR